MTPRYRINLPAGRMIVWFRRRVGDVYNDRTFLNAFVDVLVNSDKLGGIFRTSPRKRNQIPHHQECIARRSHSSKALANGEHSGRR